MSNIICNIIPPSFLFDNNLERSLPLSYRKTYSPRTVSRELKKETCNLYKFRLNETFVSRSKANNLILVISLTKGTFMNKNLSDCNCRSSNSDLRFQKLLYNQILIIQSR